MHKKLVSGVRASGAGTNYVVNDDEYRPRTPLGRRLWRIRKQIIESGQPLLGWDEIEREVASRRGERGDR